LEVLLRRKKRPRGRDHDARQLVEKTAAWFTDDHETTDLRNVRELLQTLA